MQQIDSLYEGLKNGSVTGDEARAVLRSQVAASYHMGKAESDGQVDESERVFVHEKLNGAAAMLNTARTGELPLS